MAKNGVLFDNDSTLFASEIRDASRTTQVPVALIKAIIAAESSWNPRAFRIEAKLGDASRGLMQLLYQTALNLGFKGEPGPTDKTQLGLYLVDLLPGLYQPRSNIQLGAQLLAANLRQAKPTRGSTPLDVAISAYNAGFSGVRPGDAKRVTNEPGAAIINQDYVSRVLKYFTAYGGRIDANGRPTDLPDFSGVVSGASSSASSDAGVVLAPKPILPDIDLTGIEGDVAQQLKDGLTQLDKSMQGADGKASILIYVGIILAVIAALAVFVKGKL
jgi:hypothetical protein